MRWKLANSTVIYKRQRRYDESAKLYANIANAHLSKFFEFLWLRAISRCSKAENAAFLVRFSQKKNTSSTDSFYRNYRGYGPCRWKRSFNMASRRLRIPSNNVYYFNQPKTRFNERKDLLPTTKLSDIKWMCLKTSISLALPKKSLMSGSHKMPPEPLLS